VTSLPLEVKGAAAAIFTSVLILVRRLRRAASTGPTSEESQIVEARRSPLKNCQPKAGLFSFRAVLIVTVKTQMGAKTPLACSSSRSAAHIWLW